MKFLLDENFPVTAAAFIESCGHQAIPFLSACKSGDDDEAVFVAAQPTSLRHPPFGEATLLSLHNGAPLSLPVGVGIGRYRPG